MHMICNSTDAERLYFILLCDSTHERPKSFLDFAHQQRLAIFGPKNTVNIKRRECISRRPSLISIVPPGHTGTATAINAECPNSRDVPSNENLAHGQASPEMLGFT